MKRNALQKTLVEISQELTFKSQYVLRNIEDSLAAEHAVSVFGDLTKEEKRYLLLTSLPFSLTGSMPSIRIDSLWPVSCRKCLTVVYRHTMPTGNTAPTYMVVGDAPGVGDGELKGKFDRVLVYGPSSHILRKALGYIGIHNKSWYTNLLKCSTPNNRPSSTKERENCATHFMKELTTLLPQVVITLGTHVDANVRQWGYMGKIVKVQHPSYAHRSGSSAREYSEHIKASLEQCKAMV